jgi:hypothetical protein
MNDYAEHLVRDARLIILRELAQQNDGRLNEAMLTLTLDTFGHKRSREWVRTQLAKLEELGAVILDKPDRPEAGPIFIATITRAGRDHVERRSLIDGIGRPSAQA